MKDEERIKIINEYNLKHPQKPVIKNDDGCYFGVATKCLKSGLQGCGGQIILKENIMADTQEFIILLNFPLIKQLHKDDDDNQTRLIETVCYVLSHEYMHRHLYWAYNTKNIKVQGWATACLDGLYLRIALKNYLGGHDHLFDGYSAKTLRKMDIEGCACAKLIADHVK